MSHTSLPRRFPLARQFNFSETVKQEARKRQMDLCASCGHCLNDQWEEAHHVIPDQCASRSNPNHQWIGTVLNCVVLCDPCHADIGHNGDTRTGAVAPPKMYPYSHGGNRVRHKEWVRTLDLQAAQLWGEKLIPTSS